MEVIYGQKEIEKLNKFTGVGLGNFDGLHIGHMALINTLISESKLNNLDSMVYTFTKHPENILRKSLFTPLITTLNKKIELLSETALKYLYFDEFDESYSRMRPEAFVKNILIDRLKIKLAVAGFDYRFGFKGSGDVELLKELGKKYSFKVVVIPPIKVNDNVISSTLIRNCIAKGSINKVFKLLGRHYSIIGEVKRGRRIGNTLGFPTANLIPEEYLILPQEGVYITKTLLNGVMYNSVTNVGKNPTFDDVQNLTVETHLLDFQDDIYGKSIEVFFISKLRKEKKFKSKEELLKQIKKDVNDTRDFFLKERGEK
jgi:riboflavin kinase/FMN adenylyltransferase